MCLRGGSLPTYSVKDLREFFPALSRILWLGVVVLFLVLTLSPFLTNGFYADDSIYSQSYYHLKESNSYFLGPSWEGAKSWARGGRFYFLTVMGTSAFYWFFHDLAVARAAQVFLVIVNILLCCKVLSNWLGSNRILLVFVPLLGSLFQMRIPFDPIAANPPLMQLLAYNLPA